MVAFHQRLAVGEIGHLVFGQVGIVLAHEGPVAEGARNAAEHPAQPHDGFGVRDGTLVHERAILGLIQVVQVERVAHGGGAFLLPAAEAQVGCDDGAPFRGPVDDAKQIRNRLGDGVFVRVPRAHVDIEGLEALDEQARVLPVGFDKVLVLVLGLFFYE